MNFKRSAVKSLSVLVLLIWAAFVLSAFYITQRPLALQVMNGIGATIWTILLTIILLVNSAGVGYWILDKTQVKGQFHERLILGMGIGLGVFGLGGYALGAAGWASKWILASILFGILAWVGLTKIGRGVWEDMKSLWDEWRQMDNKSAPIWIAPAVIFTALLGFLFALLPPAEGFDGLLYHLAMPERLLADKQILPYDIAQFWFPGLIEGDFIWALGLGSERTAQLIHWSFSMLTLALIFEWARIVFGNKAALWALAILISMPSLPWISAWAYTDMALTFADLACLYSIWRWSEEQEEHRWLMIAGIFAGMAVGIKYTSFILPMLCMGIILFLERNTRLRINGVMRFSLPALLIASPWFLRNGLVMGNPLYPFILGGRFWDPFRAVWLSGTGTGIGWDLWQLLQLPITLTLGYRDQNYFDGRMGPLFLLLAPLGLWTIWKYHSASKREFNTLLFIILFCALNYAAWTFGVVQSSGLWQSRLLWPGLIPFAIPIGLGLTHLPDLDLPRLRNSFIITSIMGLVIAAALLDNSLSLIFRRPLAYAFGMESRQAYFERMQPGYAHALELVDSTPADANIYFIFEPRSYGTSRTVQPDAINDHLMHDLYLHETADAVLKDWEMKGYTHILINFDHVETYLQDANGGFDEQFDLLVASLQFVAQEGEYRLYIVPN